MPTKEIPSEYTIGIIVSALDAFKKEKIKELKTFHRLLRTEDRDKFMEFIEDIDKTKVYILELMVDSLQQQRPSLTKIEE